MSQLFDMWSVENPSERREGQGEGLKESILEIIEVVRSEAAMVGGVERVILGGISKGCATAIYALLCGGIRIGGFIGISSWLPFEEDIKNICGQYGSPTVKQSELASLTLPLATSLPLST